jgi:uncharacterized protein YndB with AHSA1/START domain
LVASQLSQATCAIGSPVSRTSRTAPVRGLLARVDGVCWGVVMTTRFQVTVTVTASPQRVFELLTDPARHSEFDATGMVGPPASPARLTRAGQVFVMNMTYRDGDHIEHYQSDNHVIAFEPPRAVAWATAAHDGDPLGWLWRYDVEPVADGAAVTLTYDWADAPAENIRRFGVPLTDTEGLAGSLRLLSGACKAR